MNVATILDFREYELRTISKTKLIEIFLSLRKKLLYVQTESEKTIAALQTKLAEAEAALDKKIKEGINNTVNQPSSNVTCSISCKQL